MLQRMFHICIALYIILSVLFTTSSLLSSSSNSNSGNLFTRDLRKQIVLESTDLERHYVDESIILSKAFPHLMKPSQIIPYYLRASGVFHKHDITITSIITSNRFEILARLAQRYQGPISVTLHINNATENVPHLLESLHNLYNTTPNMAVYVDVHLVLDTFDRQFNTWRNIARLFARTEYVMMLDVDFYICTDFRETLQNLLQVDGNGEIGEGENIREMFNNGVAAFVVPAFEYINYKEGREYKTFPKTKEHLMQLVQQRRIGMFHRVWAPGHNSTDYDRFYSAKPGEIYKVTQFHSAYEPYTIFRKDGPPWCDERFIGYGGNKAACIYEMYLSGISFYVLSDHFIIHQNHLYEEKTRKNERRFNRKIYTDFKEETCLRYLRNFHDMRSLKTPKARNMIEECSRNKKLSGLIAQVSLNVSLQERYLLLKA
ncbi:hypothetical protein AGABI2DRAFT_204862 [Agaricus bisporus var. bisporus H97]|uniref:hypothetical protein n=1 Tax=Agaricus bisporus var. bisporus (strain H97 / ATCC MYA-4626 / FGSC 10389) TaxID=936046 RepID=UPI00029F7E8C|nr:hypothetical protein AGABI2DRAFT_204862 [Agaricus bisporus var. bisporus H97]EKV47580.1 hypothetical protein AGABI2DRAFT_204862 [Agaricus bisporus var. bisporus H97]